MRIQILELPYDTDQSDRPYAVIVSEIPIIDDDDPGKCSGASECAAIWEPKLKDGGVDWALFTSEEVELGAPEAPRRKWLPGALTFDNGYYGYTVGG